MKQFLIALQFLTILPIKIKRKITPKDYGASLVYFPVVGVIIGLLLVLALNLFIFLPYLVTVALVLIASIIITGGIHLDGFADTCDGLYMGKSKDKILEIMRDPHIGTMGVIGIVSLILLKFILFYTLPFNLLWKALIIMAVWGRLSQVFSCYMFDYAREDGKAKYFVKHATKRGLIFSTIFTIILSAFIMRLRGFIMFIVLIPIVLLSIKYIKRRIGGVTGDTIGAVSEISEVLILFLCLFY